MMRHVRTATLVKLVPLIVVVMLVAACSPSTRTPKANGTPAPSGPVARAVYLFNSAACQCERDRNAVAEETMANVGMADPAARRVEKIDVSQQPAELERYQKLTQFAFMPVLLGLDANGRVVRKVEGFFKETAVADLLTAP